jgi:hypothetical protein
MKPEPIGNFLALAAAALCCYELFDGLTSGKFSLVRGKPERFVDPISYYITAVLLFIGAIFCLVEAGAGFGYLPFRKIDSITNILRAITPTH